MNLASVVAGVDASPQGVRAAVVAVRLARAAHVPCRLVHAVRDPWADLAMLQGAIPLPDRTAPLLDGARRAVSQALGSLVPARLVEQMDVRMGPASLILSTVADELAGSVIVVGGKHHGALGRWITGSTAHDLIRMHDRPVLVVGPEPEGPRSGPLFDRVLVGVDLSRAAKSTLEAGEQMAWLAVASLRVLHAVEPVPGVPGSLHANRVRLAEEQLARQVWPQIRYPAAERMIRQGPAAETIVAVSQEWKADLLVLGSHGRGWVDRILIGSVAQQLLDSLPTSVLVVPVSMSASPALDLSHGASRPSPRGPAMLIDDYLPTWFATQVASVKVRAPQDLTYAAIRETDLRDPLIDALFAIRELPTRLRRAWLGQSRPRSHGPVTLAGMTGGPGWTPLGEVPGREFVVGSVGRFWQKDYGGRPVTADEFAAFDEPGYARLAISFAVEPGPSSRECVLRYEARTAVTDERAGRIFRRYWRVIRPGVEIVMYRVLRRISAEAERRAAAQVAASA